MPTEIRHWINGKPVAGRSGRTAPVFNPATGEQSGIVPLAGAEEVNEAVMAAKAAFPGWAATTPLRRARILNRFLRLLEENQERLAQTIVAMITSNLSRGGHPSRIVVPLSSERSKRSENILKARTGRSKSSLSMTGLPMRQLQSLSRTASNGTLCG